MWMSLTRLAEARHVQSLAEANPLIAGIVAGARPERADFSAQIEVLLKLPKLRGIRRALHVAPDETSQSALFAENVRRLAAHGLTFDLCVLSRQLPLALALANNVPACSLSWTTAVCRTSRAGRWIRGGRTSANWPRCPNVACKISGLVAYAGANWTADDLAALGGACHCVLRLGPRGLGRRLAGVHADGELEAVGGGVGSSCWPARRTAEREKVFHQNAERIYRV